MAKKSVREFDPTDVAERELAMWKAYYAHQFITLLLLSLAFIRSFFGVSFGGAVLPAYYAAYAAMIFRKCKGKETDVDYQKALKALTKYYTHLAKNSVEVFDVELAAKCELEWWYVDRYPERYQKTRVEALADWAAVFFMSTPERCTPYAEYREKAMLLQDEIGFGRRDAAAWQEVGKLLEQSYVALAEGLHRI